MFIVYFLTAFLATVIGSMVGLGGGVIIKPVLDSLGHFDVSTIGVLSSFTVFAMAIVSVAKQTRNKISMDLKQTGVLATGAVVGGIVGQNILGIIIQSVSSSGTVKIAQNAILAILSLFVIYYMSNKDKFKQYQIHNVVGVASVGVVLGALASFLGIGGGPINIALLTIFFSMEAKQATLNSIFIILFSQASTLVTIGLDPGFGVYDLSMLWVMIPGGIIGGFMGSHFNKKFSNEKIVKVFNLVVILVILLNIWNIISVLMG